MLEISAKNILLSIFDRLRKVWDFVCLHKKTVCGKEYIFPDKEVVRPVKFDSNQDFVIVVEKKAVAILG